MSPILDASGRPIGGDISTLDDAQVTALLGAELDRLRAPAILALPPADAFQLVALLQLIARHPQLSDHLRGTADAIVLELWTYFAECPTVLDIIQRGDDPAEDR